MSELTAVAATTTAPQASDIKEVTSHYKKARNWRGDRGEREREREEREREGEREREREREREGERGRGKEEGE